MTIAYNLNMLLTRRKAEVKSDVIHLEPVGTVEDKSLKVLVRDPVCGSMKDYCKFAIYCILLAVPLFAITVSIVRQDWIMVIIDVLVFPVGFLHGVLLLIEYFI